MPQYRKDIFNLARGPGQAIADPREDEARGREASARADRALAFQQQQDAIATMLAQQEQAMRAQSMAQEQSIAMERLAQTDRQFERDMQFRAGQADADRAFQQAGRNASVQQSGLDRELQRYLADRGMNIDVAKFNASMADNQIGRNFAREEAALGRAFSKEEAALMRAFQTGERLSGQDFTAGENKLNRQFASEERRDSEGFTALQNQLNRALQEQGINLQGLQFAHQQATDKTRLDLERERASFESAMGIAGLNMKQREFENALSQQSMARRTQAVSWINERDSDLLKTGIVDRAQLNKMIQQAKVQGGDAFAGEVAGVLGSLQGMAASAYDHSLLRPKDRTSPWTVGFPFRTEDEKNARNLRELQHALGRAGVSGIIPPTVQDARGWVAPSLISNYPLTSGPMPMTPEQIMKFILAGGAGQ